MEKLNIEMLLTDRLILIPFTLQICKNVLEHDFSDLIKMNLKKGDSWPDEDVMETLPRIIKNLSRVASPTGFESWMIIKKDSFEIIGDAGFKGYNSAEGNIDLGYGIIKEERRNGYAEEATTELIKWAFTNEIIKEITAECSIDNSSSIKLLSKLKFEELKQKDGLRYFVLKNILYQHSKI